jgi:PAS domain S-box-containing protein
MGQTTDFLIDESIWQRTFDAVPDLIFILDAQHRIVRANQAAAERLKCSCDALMGQPCYVLMHGTDEPPASCPHTQLLRDGRSHKLQFYEPRMNCHFDVSVTPFYGELGEPIGAVHVARDISHLKQVEQQLRQARDEIQQRYALAVAASLDGFWDWDLTTGHVEYSSRWETLLGYQRSEISATYDFFRSILHPDAAATVDAAITQHLLTREPFEIEYRLRHRDGHYRWFLARGQADWNETTGRATRIAGAIQDIHHRKQAEAAREERERFERLLADISARFVGGLPDDLDAEIGGAITQIRQFFSADQIALLTVGPHGSKVADPRHAAAADGVSPIPLELDAAELFP